MLELSPDGVLEMNVKGGVKMFKLFEEWKSNGDKVNLWCIRTVPMVGSHDRFERLIINEWQIGMIGINAS